MIRGARDCVTYVCNENEPTGFNHFLGRAFLTSFNFELSSCVGIRTAPMFLIVKVANNKSMMITVLVR